MKTMAGINLFLLLLLKETRSEMRSPQQSSYYVCVRFEVRENYFRSMDKPESLCNSSNGLKLFKIGSQLCGASGNEH